MDCDLTSFDHKKTDDLKKSYLALQRDKETCLLQKSTTMKRSFLSKLF